MATAYSTLLGLALPVTGELSGTWGDTVNNSITSLLDSAIAGTTTLSTDADVTLTNLDGTADTSRQAILLCTGARTAIRTITAPALSKIYTVINSTTGSPSAFSVKIVAAGPTAGVTIIAGEAAMIAWNGSDFVKVSNTGGSFTTQDLTVTGNTILGDAITDTTTLNAQTRFQSRGILGYANMTGPAATSLSTTAPAFLYSGATTYTVSDVSGGTQAFAPVISLDQATITNATTTTIYTNAATLYIAGAPNRTGLVTFTNSYALYVNAGASYLGGNTAVTGTLSATAGTSVATSSGFLTVGTVSATGMNASDIGIPNNKYLRGTVVAGTSSVALIGLDSGNIVQINANGSSGGTTVTGALSATGDLSFSTVGSKVNFATTSSATVNYVGGSADGFSLEMVMQRGASQPLKYKQDYGVGHVWSIAGSDKMTLDTSGNLGVGVTSPLNRLDVRAASAVIANYQTIQAFSTDSAAINLGGGIGLGGFYSTTTSIAVFGNITGRKENGTGGNFDGYLAFGTNNTSTGVVERARIDSRGNLGLGVTPSVWASDWTVMQIGSRSTFSQYNGNNSAFVANNVYFAGTGGSNPTYINTAAASYYQQVNGSHVWGIAPSGSGPISFSTAMTLDASGRLLLGNTDSTSAKLNVTVDGVVITGNTTGVTMGANAIVQLNNSNTVTDSTVMLLGGTTGGNPGQISSGFGFTRENSASHWGTQIRFYTHPPDVTALTTLNEAMRIDSSGRLLVGTTTNTGSGATSGKQVLQFNGAAENGIYVDDTRTSSGTDIALVFGRGTTYVGKIETTLTTTSYISASDYRLKNVTGSLTGYKERVMSLQPKQGTWVVDGSEFRGFLAHDFASQYPKSVSGKKDAVDANGKPMMQGIQASSSEVMADLVAMIQEQQALITQLTARITALEGA